MTKSQKIGLWEVKATIAARAFLSGILLLWKDFSDWEVEITHRSCSNGQIPQPQYDSDPDLNCQSIEPYCSP